MSDESRPLPYGWTKQWDDNYHRHFYVDTKASPPRSIWVHPYEDEQFLKEHPDIREKLGRPASADGYLAPPGNPPGPKDKKDGRPASYYGQSSSNAGSSKKPRGVFGKIKDAVVGTEEERQMERANRNRMMEERRAMMAQGRMPPTPYAPTGGPWPQQAGGYGYPHQYPQQYGAPSYGPPPQRRLGGGMGGMGMPLLGGLAGGLLLGSALDGFGGDGGDFGGGDFGGGDFGGGDFGGGD